MEYFRNFTAGTSIKIEKHSIILVLLFNVSLTFRKLCKFFYFTVGRLVIHLIILQIFLSRGC